MNSDATAFILAHEIAHFLVFVNHTKREAHGLIWKKTFRELLMQLISNKAFTEAVTSEISRYIHNPTATIRRNSRLYKELFGDESAENGTVALMDIAAGSRFTIGKSLKTYEKLDKRRTRYVCRCLQNKRLYLVSQHLMVNTLE
jgi:SprT protein